MSGGHVWHEALARGGTQVSLKEATQGSEKAEDWEKAVQVCVGLPGQRTRWLLDWRVEG